MDSVFLATVVGWYLVIFSLFVLFRREHFSVAMEHVVSNRGTLLLMGVITVILGLLMVVSHNVWVMGWPVVLTVFSWFVLINGLFRIFCPEGSVKMAHGLINNSLSMNITGVVFFIVGLYFLFFVYFV